MNAFKKILTTAAVPLVFGILGCHQQVTGAKVAGTSCNAREQTCAGGGCCTLYVTECGGIWPNCPKGYCCPVEDNGRAFGAPAGASPKMTKQRQPTD